MSLYEVFREQWPDRNKHVLVTEEDSVRWSELEDRVHQAVHWLHTQQCSRGDVIAIQMPKVVDAQAVMLGALATGVTILPLNPSYTASEIASLLTDSNAKHAVLLEKPPLEMLHNTPITLASAIPHALDAQPMTADLKSQDPNEIAFSFYCCSAGFQFLFYFIKTSI